MLLPTRSQQDDFPHQSVLEGAPKSSLLLGMLLVCLGMSLLGDTHWEKWEFIIHHIWLCGKVLNRERQHQRRIRRDNAGRTLTFLTYGASYVDAGATWQWWGHIATRSPAVCSNRWKHFWFKWYKLLHHMQSVFTSLVSHSLVSNTCYIHSFISMVCDNEDLIRTMPKWPLLSQKHY